jgi:hypothetical protein
MISSLTEAFLSALALLDSDDVIEDRSRFFNGALLYARDRETALAFTLRDVVIPRAVDLYQVAAAWTQEEDAR